MDDSNIYYIYPFWASTYIYRGYNCCALYLYNFLIVTYILGISAFYHDSAAALIKNGKLIAAAQEERFTRIKHDPSFPLNAIKYLIEEANISLGEIKYISFYEKPFLKFERLIETYIALFPKGFLQFKKSMPIWIKEKLFLKNVIIKNLQEIDKGYKGKNLLFSEHHRSHAASTFFTSPFERAVVLTMDGVGEWATTSVGIGYKNKIEIKKEINFPHSIGLLYSAFTYYLGFKVNSGEYKVMGLAPYGESIYKDIILKNLIDLKNDGSFKLDLTYFDFATGLKMTNKKFNSLFGRSERRSEDKLELFHMNIAASIQAVVNEVMTKITRSLAEEYKCDNLCMAGGVSLNCVTNGIIKRDGAFKKLWIQPASGDAGGAIGSALVIWYEYLNSKRQINKKDEMNGAFLGPKFSNNDVKAELLKNECSFEEHNDKELAKIISDLISKGQVIGLFRGRMEFGPRALGARSIIADPRSEKMQKILNRKIKFREDFRPFAPAILREDLTEWFDLKDESPYMMFTDFVASEKKLEEKENKNEELKGLNKLSIKRSSIPAVTHIDYSARIQTVDSDRNPFFFLLLSEFKKRTNCPILINTSFNVRGEPIVCSPADAIKCFFGTNIDILLIENFIVRKRDQNPNFSKSYIDNIVPD